MQHEEIEKMLIGKIGEIPWKELIKEKTKKERKENKRSEQKRNL
jgi:hypothetical protein